LPMEINPRVVFERMFGDAKSTEQRLAHMREDRSILDSIRAEETRVRLELGILVPNPGFGNVARRPTSDLR